MPQATTIALNDSSAISHDFVPISVNGQQSVLANGEADTGAGEMTIVLQMDRANGNRPTDRVKYRFNMPIEQTVDGVVRVNDTARAEVNIILPESLSTTQRADFAAYVANLLNNSLVSGYVEDLEPLF